MKTKRRRKQLSSEEQQKRREKNCLKNKIRKIFSDAGFQYISTNNHEMRIGNRSVEIDSLYIFENIWLLCEDTCRTNGIRDHIRTKNEAFGEVFNNFGQFKQELIKIFPQHKGLLTEYDDNRIKKFGVYISKNTIPLENSDNDLFRNLKFIQPETLEYFKWIVGCIKHSARNEIFRFLELSNADIGDDTTSSSASTIDTPIICPQGITGIKNGVRIVSFMISADALLKTCYVLRKDSWSNSMKLYQRLIDKNKIKSIRQYIEKNGEAFYNNIIVALPSNVRFKNKDGGYCSIDKLDNQKDKVKMLFPLELNSVCVIDGQHRIYAHYDSGTTSRQERTISRLRQKLHLLVTGLIFPDEMSWEDQIRQHSKIFLDINSNAKHIQEHILLQIKRIIDPTSPESIAQNVIEQLNNKGPFEGKLQICSLGGGKLKTASIVKFALKNLVSPSEKHVNTSLFTLWEGDKDSFKENTSTAIDKYVKYCCEVLNKYFGAIKEHFVCEWQDNQSMLVSVISINGFIIALYRLLNARYMGLVEFDINNIAQYHQIFKKWSFDFTKDKFPYTSSQYRKFSTEILRTVFDLREDVIEKI